MDEVRRGYVALDRLVARLRGYEPRIVDRRLTTTWHAATALILRQLDEGPPELLFIVRSTRDDDRWSGQVAFPGGRREQQDHDIAATARREASEEVGLVLDEPIARLDDQQGRTSLGRVSPFVFTLDEHRELAPEPREVAATHWVPLPHLLDPGNRTTYPWLGLRFPGIAYADTVIWGLTLRTLETFFAATGLEPEEGR